jgi:hypothetical protein
MLTSFLKESPSTSLCTYAYLTPISLTPLINEYRINALVYTQQKLHMKRFAYELFVTSYPSGWNKTKLSQVAM